MVTKLVDKWIEARANLLKTVIKGAAPYKAKKVGLIVLRLAKLDEES